MGPTGPTGAQGKQPSLDDALPLEATEQITLSATDNGLQIGVNAIGITSTDESITFKVTDGKLDLSADVGSAVADIRQQINNITAKIPTEASSTNQLADKNYVDNNGGKVDTVSINNGTKVEPVEKNINLTITKEDVGLDNVDNISASNLLTEFFSADNNIKMTVGGTTKSISDISINSITLPEAGDINVVDNQHLDLTAHYVRLPNIHETENTVDSYRPLLLAQDTDNAILKARTTLAYNGKTDTLKATNYTGKVNNYTFDLATNNTSDTWVPVLKNNTLQHRVIPAAYNDTPDKLAVDSAKKDGNGNVITDTYATKKESDSKYVTLATDQDITGIKSFKAPTKIAGTEQATATFYTANGGRIIFGKEKNNSGTMIAIDQSSGTRRLNFRSSTSTGAMVWEQPESNSFLYYDVYNVVFRRTTGLYFSNIKSASFLGTDNNGKVISVTPKTLTFTSGDTTTTYNGTAAQTVDLVTIVDLTGGL